MSLPLPRYTTTGLDDYLEIAPVVLPLPPGEPSTWTCAFGLFGPALFMARDDAGNTEALTADVLRLILAQLGRPGRDEERDPLLWASPVPAPTGSMVEYITPLLDHSSYNVRWRAALLLGHLGDQAATSALVRKLDDSDNDVRRGVVEALGRLGSPEALPILASRPWGDSDTSVDAARVIALVRMNDWEAVAVHVNEDEDEPAYELVRAILEARVSGDASEVVEVLGSGGEHLKRAAAIFLQTRPELASGHAEALVQPVIEDDGSSASVDAALTAGLGGAEAAEPLVEMLESAGWRGRMFAAMALGSLAPEHLELVRGPLVEHLTDDDNDVRRESALALVRLGHLTPEVEAVLSKESSSEYLYPQRAAELAHSCKPLETLGMVFGTIAPDRRLLPALVDPGVGAKERGFMAMMLALTEPDLVHVLLDAMARDDSRDVPLELRRACAGALLLTGYPPETVGSVHRILLCHQGEVSSSPRASVEQLWDRAGELVMLASKDGDWPVRIDALRLLQMIGGQEDHAAMLEHISRHDPDVDCRKQAASMLPTSWRSVTLAHRLAQAMVATRTESDAKPATFRALAEADPAIGLLLAGRFLASDERELARASAQIVGSTVQAPQVRDAVGGAMGRLSGGWVQREAAVDLLGFIPASLYGEDLLEEVVEILRDKAENDDDVDVQNAAKASLGRLGHPWEE